MLFLRGGAAGRRGADVGIGAEVTGAGSENVKGKPSSSGPVATDPTRVEDGCDSDELCRFGTSGREGGVAGGVRSWNEEIEACGRRSRGFCNGGDGCRRVDPFRGGDGVRMIGAKLRSNLCASLGGSWRIEMID